MFRGGAMRETMQLEIMKVFRCEYEAALKDKHRMELLEEIYSTPTPGGSRTTWSELLNSAAERGFRWALDHTDK